MGEDMELLYPEDLDFKAMYEKYAYRDLDTDTLRNVNNLWEKLKVESASLGNGIYISCAVILVLLVAYALFSYARKLHRRRYYAK